MIRAEFKALLGEGDWGGNGIEGYELAPSGLRWDQRLVSWFRWGTFEPRLAIQFQDDTGPEFWESGWVRGAGVE